MKQAGPALGYGRYADAITQDASGQYQVQRPGVAQRDPQAAHRSRPPTRRWPAPSPKANAAALSDRLGRAPSEGELYIAHFLGAGGAARLINLAASNPNAKAAEFFPEAAQANSPIFYDRATGTARSVAQVRNILTARYEVALKTQGHLAATAQAPEVATAQAAALARRHPGYCGHHQRLRRRHSAAPGAGRTGVSCAVCGSKPHRTASAARERALGLCRARPRDDGTAVDGAEIEFRRHAPILFTDSKPAQGAT